MSIYKKISNFIVNTYQIYDKKKKENRYNDYFWRFVTFSADLSGEIPVTSWNGYWYITCLKSKDRDYKFYEITKQGKEVLKTVETIKKEL